MRLRIRIMLLTVALVTSLNQSAEVNGYGGLVNPFHWLFGCGYGCDDGCGYGAGYDGRLATYRIIDDWLGYGYLRNQEGTLGHYPGQPFGGYRPFFHGLFHPCPQPAPALAMPAPMPAPMPMPAPIYNPCWDPCQDACSDPCGDPCAMAPMTMPVPVTTWRPMTVMVPQTQWVNVPQMPMGMPMGTPSDCGGCDSCGGGTMMPTPGMMPGQVIQGTMLQGMQTGAYPSVADSGCGCSGGGTVSQPVPQTAFYSPSSQYYSTGVYGSYPGYASNMMPQSTAWHPQMTWQPQTAWNNAGPWNGAQWTAQMSRRDTRRYASMARRYGWNEPQMMAFQPSPGYATQTAMRPWTPNTMAWNPMMGQQAYYGNPAMMRQTTMMRAPVMQPQMAYSNVMPTTSYNTVMMQPAMTSPVIMNQPMASGWTVSQPTVTMQGATFIPGPAMPGNMMPGTTVMNPMVAGDIVGDHEVAAPSTASVPIIQNSFRGSVPVTRANMTRPLQMSASRSYPNVVR